MMILASITTLLTTTATQPWSIARHRNLVRDSTLEITVVTDGHDSSVNQSINKAFVTHTVIKQGSNARQRQSLGGRGYSMQMFTITNQPPFYSHCAGQPTLAGMSS